MHSARLHYEELLGGVYAWSVSAGADPCERGKNWLLSQGLMDAERYLDLGAGFGAHALPLLAAGKQVTAVDFSAELLAQLISSARGAPGLTTERADLVQFLEAASGCEWDVISCLGDTLTHLEDEGAVQRLLSKAVERLSCRGRLALSYRDSSTFQAEGVARFIQVARDETRVMHCLLEPISQNRMRVTDIVTEVAADGPRTRLGEYTKLRLSGATLVAWAEAVGFTLLRQHVEPGMTSLVFRR